MTDATSRDLRRKRYQTVLSTIYHQTGDPQHVMCSTHTLWRALTESIGEDESVTVVKAALDNDDIIKWRDGGCRARYALTGSGIEELDNYTTPIYDGADEEALRDVIEVETTKQDPNRDVIGWCNRRLAALGGESDG